MGSRPSQHRLDPSIVREYDIRGEWEKNLFPEDAYLLGRAIASMLNTPALLEQLAPALCWDPQCGRNPRIVVGRDGRLSSLALEGALVSGLQQGGVDVVQIGLGPSPMAYFAERSIQNVEGAVQVTGSHNPGNHNGFKIVLGGRPFFGAQLQELALRVAVGDLCTGGGRVEKVDIMPAYIDALLRAISKADTNAVSRLRIGWDAGNGATGSLLEFLTTRLPGTHHLLHSAVDGRFPNHHPDPTLEANLSDLQYLVASKNLDFGVAFDGDGDRLGVIDGLGQVIWADQLLAIFASDILKSQRHAKVVADVKMSDSLFEMIESAGGQSIMAPSGHSHIKSTLHDSGALLGGEMSGHFFFADDWFGFDDGVYSALRLIDLVARSGRTLAEIAADWPQRFSTPELRFSVAPDRRLAIVEEVTVRMRETGCSLVTIDGLRVINEDGWWLLRASNTQDMLSVRAESETPSGLERLLGQLDAQLALCGVQR